jgi:hypothetical protein
VLLEMNKNIVQTEMELTNTLTKNFVHDLEPMNQTFFI